MNEEIITLGELSVAILADELFLRSSRPPRSSEQSGVVVGVERGLAQPLSHEESRTDVW